MIAFIIGVLVIIGSSVGISRAFFPTTTSFTPGRRTRGIARWWHRCTRWVNRLRVAPRKTAQSTLQPVPWVMSHEQVITARQMQQLGRAMTGVRDRPTTAEFAAAPLYGYAMVDRLLKDLDDAGGR